MSSLVKTSELSGNGSSRNRVLIVDSDKDLCETISRYLTIEGFQVESVRAGKEAVGKTERHSYALVILDVMLPDVSGFEVLRRIRSRSQVPVLILTARSDEVDRIVGLEIGADDYLSKPFNPRELLARIRAILRRTKPEEASDEATSGKSISLDDIELEGTSRVVLRSGQPMRLTSAEFNLLEVLLDLAGQVVPREDLVRRALGRDLSPFDRSLDMHISNLRKKLGPGPEGVQRIRTIRGVGYLYAYARRRTRAV